MSPPWLGLQKYLPLGTPRFSKRLLDNRLRVASVARAIQTNTPSHTGVYYQEKL